MCQTCLSVFPPQQKTKIEMTMMEMTYGSKPSTPVKKYATPSGPTFTVLLFQATHMLSVNLQPQYCCLFLLRRAATTPTSAPTKARRVGPSPLVHTTRQQTSRLTQSTAPHGRKPPIACRKVRKSGAV